MSETFDVTVVCPVGRLAGDLGRVHAAFEEVLARTGRRVEFVYVLDGPRKTGEEALRAVPSRAPRRIYRMAKGFGEAEALHFAFGRARGRFVVSIPDHFQAAPESALAVLERLDAGDEVVVTRREPRRDPWINQLQSRAFHALVKRVAGRTFHDMTCGLRGFTREAALSLDLYGDLHRFIPLIASKRGFRTVEIAVAQRSEDAVLRVFGPTVYARRLLDILHVFFVTKFTRKPLRFFGLVGLGLGTVGFLITATLAAMRLFGKTALTNRPLLLLGLLLIVLGVQVISIGLVGEMVIYFSSRDDETPVVELDAENDGDGAAS